MAPIFILVESDMSRTARKNGFFVDCEGRGTFGCLFSLALLLGGVFAGTKMFPPYYSAFSFETDLKTEISRAGAHFYDDERTVREILDLAKRNEVTLEPDDVKLQHVAGQLHVTVDWAVPVDFVLFEHTFSFNAKASSYMGTL